MLQSSLDWGPKPAIEEQHLSWGERFLPWFWNISGHQVNVRLHSPWSISFNHDILVMPTLKRSMKSGWRLSPTWCLRTYLKMIGCVMHCIRRSEIPTWWCMTSSNMNRGWKEILGEHISILSTRLSATLPGSEKTSTSRPGKSMPEILLAEVGRLRLLLLLQLLLMQTPKRKQRPTQRRRLLQSPKRNLTRLLYYHHLNQSNMPKEKGKEEKESQRAEVPVLVTRRRYHATSISSRSLAEKERTVNTVTTKRHLMLARVVGMVKGVVKHQEDNLQQTRPRRSTSHAGTGRRANVDMVTSATSGMMLTCSILHQIPSLHHRKQPLHFSTTTVMWMSHLSWLLPM